jgi:3-oxoacyl-[acyl-carrier protein] reductase
MKLLEGKTAIVTGAARGIDEAVAIKLAEQVVNVE